MKQNVTQIVNVKLGRTRSRCLPYAKMKREAFLMFSQLMSVAEVGRELDKQNMCPTLAVLYKWKCEYNTMLEITSKLKPSDEQPAVDPVVVKQAGKVITITIHLG